MRMGNPGAGTKTKKILSLMSMMCVLSDRKEAWDVQVKGWMGWTMDGWVQMMIMRLTKLDLAGWWIQTKRDRDLLPSLTFALFLLMRSLLPRKIRNGWTTEDFDSFLFFISWRQDAACFILVQRPAGTATMLTLPRNTLQRIIYLVDIWPNKPNPQPQFSLTFPII